MSMKTSALITHQLISTARQGNDVPLLLSTKLTLPRRGRGILPRPRLESLALDIAERRLTVLKAPPGFGKTTLATIWADSLAADGHAIAWLSLDDEDNSPQRLLYYIAAALNQAEASVGRACLGLRAELSFFSTETLASLTINELSHLERPLTLFLDDFHRISDSVLVEGLRFFLQRAPDSFHVVFTGRRDLPAALRDHLYADDLLELDSSQLRFTLEETRDLLKKAGTDLEQTGELLAVQAASEGWIAALRALLLTPRSSAGSSLKHLAPRSICNLFDDMLQGLSVSHRQDVYRLGMLNKFNVGLLSRLLGSATGSQLLELLQQHQLFISPLDSQHTWFSLHPLFREHLKRICVSNHPGEAQDIQLVAANWFAEQELWLDAIGLGLEGGDADQVRAWIAQCAMELIEQGDFAAVAMLETCWKVRAEECPLPLKMARAWAMGLMLEADGAQALLSEIEAQLWQQGTSHSNQSLYCEVQALRALLLGLADQNELSGALAEACYRASPPRVWVRNVLLNLMSCSHYHASRWDAFYILPPTTLGSGRQPGLIYHDCYRQSLHALAESAQGRLGDAVGCLENLLERLAGTFCTDLDRPNPALTALPVVLLAQMHYLMGNRQAAESRLAESMGFINTGGFLDCTAAAYCTSARLSWQQGNSQRARRTLEHLDGLATERGWNRLRARVLMERTRINLLDHKCREAMACTHGLNELLSKETSHDNTEIQVFAVLCELWLALHRIEETPILIERASQLLDILARRQLQLMRAEVSLVLGLLLCTKGRDQDGRPLLDDALDMIKQSGAISLLQDLPLAPSCADAIRQFYPAWWQQAGKYLRGGGAADTCTGMSECTALLELTVKERQVMRLVAEGKSNKQIARDLNVTPETIKSHMKSIFAKLKVDSRAQAAVMLQNA